MDWIGSLPYENDTIKKSVKSDTIQLSLFDERDLAEITSPDYPGERLIVCRNPRLADERARKRKELLAAADGLPVQSFQCLLGDLATLCKSRVHWTSTPGVEFERIALPTDVQQRAFELLGVPITS